MFSCDRWKVDAKGAKVLHTVSKKPILQFVSIKRKDCGEWAIPGVGGCVQTFFSHFIDVGVLRFPDIFLNQWFSVTDTDIIAFGLNVAPL